jgi:hypothetical protein
MCCGKGFGITSRLYGMEDTGLGKGITEAAWLGIMDVR